MAPHLVFWEGKLSDCREECQVMRLEKKNRARSGLYANHLASSSNLSVWWYHPNMLSARRDISPWILLVFCTIEQCLCPLQERQWCFLLLSFLFHPFNLGFEKVGMLPQWIKVGVLQFCAATILRPEIKLVPFSKSPMK